MSGRVNASMCVFMQAECYMEQGGERAFELPWKKTLKQVSSSHSQQIYSKSLDFIEN